jgi:hypothetical protein
MSKIGLLALLVALCAAAGVGYGFTLLRRQQQEIDALKGEVTGLPPKFDQFKGAVRDIGRELTSLVLDEIDLNRPGWQAIGKGFYVIDLTVGPDPKGTLLRGKVINTTAVVHEALLFRARIGDAAASFKIEKAAPAVALPFEVAIPVPTPPAGTPRGFVTLETSTISFSSSTSKAPAPREPPDPDKLLR